MSNRRLRGCGSWRGVVMIVRVRVEPPSLRGPSVDWQRQHDGEGAALAGSTLDQDLSTVQNDDISGQAQAQANAAGRAPVAGVKPVERLEYRLQFMRRDADPLVAYADRGHCTAVARRKRNLSPLGGVATGILQQLGDDLSQFLAIAKSLHSPVDTQCCTLWYSLQSREFAWAFCSRSRTGSIS